MTWMKSVVAGCTRLGVAVLVGAALLVGLNAAPSSASSFPAIPSGPIHMAGIYPLSGPYAAYGQSEEVIEKALIDYMNTHGGIAGHKIAFQALNDQLDPTVAASDAEQLVSQGVTAILSVGTETEAPADVPVFMKGHVPVVFYNPGDTWANGVKWPYYFMTLWTTLASTNALLKEVKAQGIKSVGIASDNTGFGTEFLQDAVKSAGAYHVKVVKTVQYPTTAVSLNTQMQELKAAGADALVIGGGGGFNQAFAGLQAIGWSPPIYSYSSITHLPKFGGLAGTPLAATSYFQCDGYCIKHPNGQLPPKLKSLTNYLLPISGPVPDPAVNIIGGYDALSILKYAIEKQHTLNGPAIRQAILGIKNKSFTVPSFKYTYTVANHQGLRTNLPIGNVGFGMNTQGYPYLASGQAYSS
jgi:branched-chain amino acid transport system substrate-binding protein